MLLAAIAVMGAAPATLAAGVTGKIVYVDSAGTLDCLELATGKQVQLVAALAVSCTTPCGRRMARR
jgi:hypothetical protein